MGDGSSCAILPQCADLHRSICRIPEEQHQTGGHPRGDPRRLKASDLVNPDCNLALSFCFAAIVSQSAT